MAPSMRWPSPSSTTHFPHSSSRHPAYTVTPASLGPAVVGTVFRTSFKFQGDYGTGRSSSTLKWHRAVRQTSWHRRKRGASLEGTPQISNTKFWFTLTSSLLAPELLGPWEKDHPFPKGWGSSIGCHWLFLRCQFFIWIQHYSELHVGG